MYVGSGAIGFFTVHKVLGINHLSCVLIFLFYFGSGRRGTVHENVVFPVAKAGEVACRNGRHLYSYTMTGYCLRLNDNQLSFLAFHFSNCTVYNSHLLHDENSYF